jgi:copper(I)-binding protein
VRAAARPDGPADGTGHGDGQLLHGRQPHRRLPGHPEQRRDKLVSARSSAGGTITLSGPAGGNPAAMRAVAAITVPGHTLIRLVPNGYHLIISDSGPMKSGTEITLTLRFAHAGTYHVAAEVTNPQTGGSSYFLN